MYTFTPQEMVNIYRQASNKENQIKIFSETEMISQEEVVEILISNGVDQRTLPKKFKGGRWKIAADSIQKHPKRELEDDVIDRLDAELEQKRKNAKKTEYTPIIADAPERITDREEIGRRLQKAIDEQLGQDAGTDDELDPIPLPKKQEVKREVKQEVKQEPERTVEVIAAPNHDRDLNITLSFIRGLFERKNEITREMQRLRMELTDIKKVIQMIVAVSQECDEEE